MTTPAERFTLAQNKKAASRFHVRQLVCALNKACANDTPVWTFVQADETLDDVVEYDAPESVTAYAPRMVYAPLASLKLATPSELRNAQLRAAAWGIRRVRRGKKMSEKTFDYMAGVFVARTHDEKCAAFIVATDAPAWIYERATNELIAEKVRLTMPRLALRIQKIERAMTRLTGAKDTNRDVDNVYDGTVIDYKDASRKVGKIEYDEDGNALEWKDGAAYDNDIRHYNFTQLRGTRGRRDNIVRLASIPPRASCVDPVMLKLRTDMLALREWIVATPRTPHDTPRVHSCSVPLTMISTERYYQHRSRVRMINH